MKIVYEITDYDGKVQIGNDTYHCYLTRAPWEPKHWKAIVNGTINGSVSVHIVFKTDYSLTLQQAKKAIKDYLKKQ